MAVACRPYYKRSRRWLSENTEEMVKEKLQRVNEPGVVVKCLFDPMTMDDIPRQFASKREKPRPYYKQTFQPQQLAFRQASVIILCFNPSFNFWVNHVLLTFSDSQTNLLARAQTFSSYKHHNTVKVFIAPLLGRTLRGPKILTSYNWYKTSRVGS